MLPAVFVQMAGNSVVDVPRGNTSWFELYEMAFVTMAIEEGVVCLVESEDVGNDGEDWLGEETSDGGAW